MLLPIDVLPTPGGPTRHMILPCTDSLRKLTAMCSRMRSFTSSSPKWSSSRMVCAFWMSLFSTSTCPQGMHVSHSRYVRQMLNSEDDGSIVPSFASSASITFSTSSGMVFPSMASRNLITRVCFSSFSMPSSLVICFICSISSTRRCSLVTFSSTWVRTSDCSFANSRSFLTMARTFFWRSTRFGSASTACRSSRCARDMPAMRSPSFSGLSRS
mmetsp:Transcript_10325/g.30665  ORF Transcript_10325/g.30665 Transcript_10325/m.30665 type:complete len:214 (+) Transcript_10325:1675-2316(+)